MSLDGDFFVENVAGLGLDEQQHAFRVVEGRVAATALRRQVAVELVEVAALDGGPAITVDKTVDWKDGGSIPTTVGGYHINDVPGRLERIETFLLSPFKRVWIRPFFRFIVRTGSTGSEENFLDPDDHPENVDQLQERYTARKDGELFFYVNDGVIALPHFDGAFYSRNQGTAKITVERF